MSIATLAEFDSATKLRVRYRKTSWNTTCNNNGPWGDPVSIVGDPGAVTPVSNTTTGVVPTNVTSGYPSFALSSVGYLTHLQGHCVATNNNATRFILYDRLFECGPFVGGHAAYSLSGQPSFASRISTYAGLLLLLTIGGTNGVGASGTAAIGYLDESGVARTATRSFSGTQATTFSCTEIVALAAGAKGVQQITSVDASGLSNGNNSFNLVIARPLCTGALSDESFGIDARGMDQLGMPIVYPGSALSVLQAMGFGTSFAGGVDLMLEIASAPT